MPPRVDVKIPLPPEGSTEPPKKYWRDYFSKHQPPGPAIADLALRLTSQKKYEQAIAVLEAALISGQAEPWMYEVLAVSMQLAGRPKAEVERALLSRIDFSATDVPTTLFSAAYLTRFGAKEQAIKLYRQAAEIEPTRPEAYVLALRLARERKDYDAIAWAAPGVLRTAWTRDHEQLHRDAEDAALDAERGLKSVGRQSDADALRAAMTHARTRDLFVRLQWAGDGDLDLSVDEPLGTTCSVIDPQSQGGGVHMHDGYGPKPEDCYEEYICALGRPEFTSSASGGSTATSSASGRSSPSYSTKGDRTRRHNRSCSNSTRTLRRSAFRCPTGADGNWRPSDGRWRGTRPSSIESSSSLPTALRPARSAGPRCRDRSRQVSRCLARVARDRLAAAAA